MRRSLPDSNAALRGKPRKKTARLAAVGVVGLFLCACGAGAPLSFFNAPLPFFGEASSGEEPVIRRALSSLPAPSADALVTFSCADTVIDASHTEAGYIMADYRGDSSGQKLKIVYPGQEVYLYSLHGGYEVFPLTGGSGGYTVSVLQNTGGDNYLTTLTAGIDVSIEDPLSPFLLPNRFVGYSPGCLCATEAERLAAGQKTTPEVIDAVYGYVTENVEYDTEKAKQVDQDYFPQADATLRSGKGICFDYASLLCAMLRSRQIPAMLVTGYSGPSYHAWVRVYSETGGTVDGCIPVKKGWNLLDPSYAASHTAEETLAHISGDSVYTPEHYY